MNQKLKDQHDFLNKHFYEEIAEAWCNEHKDRWGVLKCTCGLFKYNAYLKGNLERTCANFESNRRVDFMGNIYTVLTIDEKADFIHTLQFNKMDQVKIDQVKKDRFDAEWYKFDRINKGAQDVIPDIKA